LKNELKECKIFGPDGDPNAVADPQKVTLVPFESLAATSAPPPEDPKRSSYNLTDARAALLSPGTGDIFGADTEVRMPAPDTSVSASAVDVRIAGQGQSAGTSAPEASLRSRAPQYQPQPQGARWASVEEIEMRQK